MTPEPKETELPHLCYACGKPATCIGQYEGCTGPVEFACDECCGHGNEDGWCCKVEGNESLIYALTESCVQSETLRTRLAAVEADRETLRAVIDDRNVEIANLRVYHTRLAAAEKERDSFLQCLLNREESLKRSDEDWVEAKKETDRVKLKLAATKKALTGLLEGCVIQDGEVMTMPFLKRENILNAAEALKGEG